VFFPCRPGVKREILVGELRNPVNRRLVVVAALGGMILPAAIYAIINILHGAGVPRGWGIPMATDTALAVGVLALAGPRLPPVLTALALACSRESDSPCPPSSPTWPSGEAPSVWR
jgi:NhaA family Na+:H+ antiporter